MKKILYIIGAMLTLASCTTETLDVPIASDSCVNFTTENSITRATENKSSWSEGDLIGISAIDSSSVVQDSNVQYKATSSGTTTSFSAASDDDKILYPSSSDSLTFYAYYPYSESVEDEKIPIDLATTQSDLLVSQSVTNNQATGGNVNLVFSHALTLVEITMSTSDEISSLEGLTGYITDSYTAGSYDLLASSSNLSVDTTQGEIELTVVLSGDKTSATITALVMPYDYGASDGDSNSSTISIYFEIGDHIYYNELQPTWAAAYKYSYTAKIGSDNLTLEAVAIEAWEDETESAPGTTLVDIFYNRSDEKYYINSAKGLAAFRDLVNGSTNTTDALFWGFDGDLFDEARLDIDGVLTTDIDLSDLGSDDWTPIGYSSSTTEGEGDDAKTTYYKNYYAGTFDGDGHQISNLYINNESNQQALFRYIGSDGVVCNLGVSGNVTCTAASGANYETGGIAAWNEGFIINCYSLVNVTTAITKVGGIAGHNVGNVVNCYNHGNITGSTNVGGIVGYNYYEGYVGYCYSIGELSASGDDSGTRVGGVVGYNIEAEGANEAPTIKGSFCLSNTAYSIGQLEKDAVSGTLNTNVYDSDYLQSELFTLVMNNGAYTYNDKAGVTHTASPIPACAWIYNSGDYPTLDFGATPEYTISIYDIVYDTTSSTYQVYSGLGLQAFAALVNGDSRPTGLRTQTDDADYLVFDSGDNAEIDGQLMRDVDLVEVCYDASTSWTPIGSDSNKYQGTFDGDGHKVSNLYINTDSDYQGLFGSISDATIKNLGVDGSVTSSADYCHIGGIVGDTDSSSSITACYNLCNVIASGSGGAYIGGIVGNSGASITACYNAGAISAKPTDDVYIGGIAGQSAGSITSCYSYGSVSSADGGNDYDSLGGVAGSSTSISYCYYDTTTVGKNVVAGYFTPTYAVGGTAEDATTVEGLTTTEMTTDDTLLGYLKTESAVADYWYADYTGDNSINNGYPILKWQTSETE